MVQKQTYSSEYIEFQEVNPSRVTPVEVPQRCRKGGVKVDIQPVSRVEAALRRTLSKENLSSVWVATKPARALLGWSVAVVSRALFSLMPTLVLLGLVGYVFWQAGVWCKAVGVFKYVAIGGTVCLVGVVVMYIRNNTKRAVPFDDWQKKDTATTTHTAGVVVNQVVNIVNGEVKN